MAGKNDIDKILESIRELRASQEKTDEQLRKTDEQLRRTAEELRESDKRLRKQIGELTGGWGRFVEDLMAPGIHARFKEIGFEAISRAERFQAMEDGRVVAEHDVVLFGMAPGRRETVVLVSVKSRLKSADIDELIADIQAFHGRFPLYADHDLIGAAAGVGVHHSVRRYAEKKGIYAIDSGEETARIVNRAGSKPRIWPHRKGRKMIPVPCDAGDPWHRPPRPR